VRFPKLEEGHPHHLISIFPPDPKKNCNFLVLITSVGPIASI